MLIYVPPGTDLHQILVARKWKCDFAVDAWRHRNVCGDYSRGRELYDLDCCSLLCHWPIVWHGASDFTSPYLSFPICTMGRKIWTSFIKHLSIYERTVLDAITPKPIAPPWHLHLGLRLQYITQAFLLPTHTLSLWYLEINSHRRNLKISQSHQAIDLVTNLDSPNWDFSWLLPPCPFP